ncbi:MAG TPA: hypothetical protein VEO95_03320 [Chthoniobacteraceae bacterium]|nr:hypothetical protein [Chthoniobacteraceae bacterium]
MSIEQIRSFRNAKPFRPFDVILNDGQALPVVRPERMAIAPWGRIGVYVGSVPHFFRIDDVSEIKQPATRDAS